MWHSTFGPTLRGDLKHALRLVWLLVALGCQRPTSNPNPQARASASASAQSASPSPGSFDLASADTGAVLVAADIDHGLSLTTFDADGRSAQRQPLSTLAVDTVVGEVAAATSGAELGVVWTETSKVGTRARGLVRPVLGQGRNPALEIGAMQLPLSEPRGNLAIGRSEAHFLVLARGARTECVDPTRHDCVGFDFFRLNESAASRTGLPLAVPLPCLQNSVSFAVSSKRWFYGVCSQGTGKPLTTLFSIQDEPAYARADNVLEGCLPLGALADGGDLVVVGECDGTRRAVRVRSGNAEVQDVGVEHLDVVCESGQPLIRQLGASGLHLLLDARRDRLEAFLPDALRRPNARAVWTGRALLVAWRGTSSSTIAVARYRCDSTMLREFTD